MNEHFFSGSRSSGKKDDASSRHGGDDDSARREEDDQEDVLGDGGSPKDRAGAFPGRDPYSRRLPAPRSRQALTEQGYYPAALQGQLDGSHEVAEDAGFDLRKYLWLLFKHRWLILGCALLAVGIGVMYTLLTTPIYRASTTLQISRDVAKVVDVEGFQQVEAGRDAEFYQTQFELLRSRSLAERVVTSLELHDDAAFLGSDVPSPWTNLRRMVFGEPPPADVTSSADVAARQRAATGKVMGGLSLQPVNNSTIVRLSFDSSNPALAQKVVNAIADSYITVNLERRYGASTYARTFLEERLEELKLRLEESERSLVAYADDQQIVSPASGQTLTQTDLVAANSALTEATTRRLKAELVWQQMESSDGISVPQMLESKSIGEKRVKRAELATVYSERLEFFKPAYPEMVRLQAQIDELDRQVAEEAALIRAAAKSQYETALAEEESLNARLEELKAEFTDFRNRNIQYTILQREVDTNRTLYDGLLQRYKEIGVAGGVGTNNVAVVDRAEVPGAPFTPNLRRNMMMSLMLGLLLGAGAAFAREQLDDTFKSPDDIEENLGVPLLGIIPQSSSSTEHRASLDDPRSALSEAYRSLRTALQFSTSSGVPKILLVTSARASEGKSTTAVTLARNYAQLGMKVLLIDADLRRPTLHAQLGLDSSVGLTNCLASDEVPKDVFRKTETPGLTFMPSGPLPPNPAELLAGPKLLALLTVASEQYDLVIVDGPPVAGLADAPLLSSIAMGTLFVIDGGATRRNAAKGAMKRLHFARAQVVGAVINKLTIGGFGYGYGYGYQGYGYGDTDYYGQDAKAEIADQRATRDA